MIPDRRNRPWRRLRVVVEVTVPPTSRATEKDLRYAIEGALPREVALPRPEHRDAHVAPLRLKLWAPFFTAARIKHKRGEPV